MRAIRSAGWRASFLLAASLVAGLVGAADAGVGMVAMLPDAPDWIAGSDSEELFLEIVLNGVVTGRIARVRRDFDRLRVSSAALRELGFRLRPDTPAIVNITRMAGVQARYDEAAQRLALDVAAELVDQEPERLNARISRLPQPETSAGMLLNYDVHATRTDDRTKVVSLLSELRAFGEWGVVSHAALVRRTDSAGTGSQSDAIRLDTTYSRSFVGSALTLRLGDAIAGGLGWTRATRFAGLQVQRNFALQPELVTFPVPAFRGQANLPSTVDLYLDGVRQFSGQVPAGPFELSTMPVVNGAGTAEMVVTDLLGAQRVVVLPFYTTSRLLRAGLSSYSLDVGFVRRNYGLESSSYSSDPMVSATWRLGVRDWLTLEGQLEGTPSLTLGGAGAVLGLGRAGVVDASFALSTDDGERGRQASLGYGWRNRRFNFALGTQRSFDAFRDIASAWGAPPPQRSDRVIAGMNLGRNGSLGLSYFGLQYPGAARMRLASAFYSRSLGPRISLSVSYSRDLDRRHGHAIFAGLALALEDHISASLSASRQGRSDVLSSLDVSRPVDPDGGLGWRARIQDGPVHGGLVEAGYRGARGQAQVGVQRSGGARQAWAGVSGALVLMDGQLLAARPIHDAFAVVSTDGLADVPVQLENRPIGRTGAGGTLLVTPLNAYQRNRLGIDPMHLPASTDVSRVEADVVPSDRAGTLVRFGIVEARAASVILHDATGHPLPLGTRVSQPDHDGEPALVGYDGLAYLEGLQEHNRIEAHLAEGSSCTASFDYAPRTGELPTIGPLACE